MSARYNLLNAAASLVAAEGVTALGVERVVQEAGVSKGSFFYHFATKEEMIRALLDHVVQGCMSEVDEAVSNGASLTDALIDMVVGELRQNGALIAVLVASVTLDASLRATLTDRCEKLRSRLIDEGGLSPECVDLLQLAIDGAMIGTVLYNPAGRMKRAANAERILRSIIEG